MTSSRTPVGLVLPAVVALAAFAVTSQSAVAACVARAKAASTAPPSPSPSQSAAPAPLPRLYTMGDEFFTLDRDATAYYYFQGNRDGTAKAKKELRYDRNLWDTCAQLQIRLPFITRYPTEPNSYSPNANPYSGFGNAELRYSYSVASKSFDHALEAGIAFPTATNGVESLETVLKFFYTTKWKWSGGSVAYTNEYDQTVIRPPGASYTSYYEGKVTLPNVSFVDSPAWRGLKFSAIYNFRVLFNDGGLVQDAVGGIVSGSAGDVGLLVVDSWGIGRYGLWKYKVEGSAVVGLP
ncbi:MAG TPA: hypothetical protein VK755_05360 [Candidatus Acidoferrales bacterium]|nr:hypothetical protein [Candidatus Acidoferrales bacterium]